MKKLFLTSGIIACMACPAFATGTGITPTYVDYDGTNNPPTSYVSSNGDATIAQLSGATVADACVQPVLDTFSGSTTFTAIWQSLIGTVTLDDNYYYAGGATASRTPNTNTEGTPDPLYTVYGYGQSDAVAQGAGIYGTQANAEAHTSPITALTTVPSMTGYTLTGYSSAKTNGTSYITPTTSDNVTTWNIDPSLANYGDGVGGTLYAQWTANQYNITFDAGTLPGSSVDSGTMPATKTVTFDLEFLTSPNNVITFESPTAYGYTFTGWQSDNVNLQTGETGADITYGSRTANGSISAYKVDGDPELTAQWTPNTYTITYACSGGNTDGSAHTGGTPASQTFEYNEPVTLRQNIDDANCYKNGYHFTGWTCTATAASGQDPIFIADPDTTTHSGALRPTCNATTGTCTYAQINNWRIAGIANSNSYTDNNNPNSQQIAVACVANYAANEISLTYVLAGGSINDSTEDVTGTSCIYDSSITLPANPTRTGYTFQGWDTTSHTVDPAHDGDTTTPSEEPNNG